MFRLRTRRSEKAPAGSFVRQLVYRAALAAAKAKGIEKARWVTVQYDFDYDPTKILRKIADDPIFIGSSPYSAES